MIFFLGFKATFLIDIKQSGLTMSSLTSNHSKGFPQGSILGPLLFLIYYNDLLSSLDCSIDAHADDSTMSATGKTVAEVSATLTVVGLSNGGVICI